ncbi:hypothetical protein KSS87_011170 [Heliosperma pusillum]|nr:hypothetical protein KSS87_011170 [Heliosperma pusillum]
MGKVRGDITEIPNKYASIGVRTRSRTLALQPISDLSFLQLRTRRLQKPLFQHSPPPAGSTDASKENVGCHVTSDRQGRFGHFDCGVDEASFGDNILEFGSTKSTRECRPNSLNRDAEVIGTPSSTTQSTCSFTVNHGDCTMQSAIPTTLEMEEFFAAFELHQQQLFLQRYNYDIVNDMSHLGRYEWVRVDN